MDKNILFVPSFPFDKYYIEKIILQLQADDPFVVLGIDDEQKKYSMFDIGYSGISRRAIRCSSRPEHSRILLSVPSLGQT